MASNSISNNVPYPYIHYHYANFANSTTPNGSANDANALFRKAMMTNQQINLVEKYDAKNYNQKALEQFDGLLTELKNPAEIENAIVEMLNEQMSEDTSRQIDNIINFNQKFSSLAGQSQATSDRLLKFIDSLSYILQVPVKDTNILKSIILNQQMQGSKKLVNLANLAKDLTNQTGLTQINHSEVNNFLNQFATIIQSSNSKSDKTSQFKTAIKSILNAGIGEEIDAAAAQEAISSVFSKIQDLQTTSTLTGNDTRAQITYDNKHNIKPGKGGIKSKPDSIIRITKQGNGNTQGKFEINFDFGISSKYYSPWFLKKFGVHVHTGNFYSAALAALRAKDSATTRHLIGNTVSLLKGRPTDGGPYATLSAAILKKFAVEYFTGTGWTLKQSGMADNAHILLVNGKPYSMRKIVSEIGKETDVTNLFKFAHINTINKALNKWVGKSGYPDDDDAITRSESVLSSLHSLQMQIKFHPEAFLERFAI
jgi:hypothetical protein